MYLCKAFIDDPVNIKQIFKRLMFLFVHYSFDRTIEALHPRVAVDFRVEVWKKKFDELDFLYVQLHLKTQDVWQERNLGLSYLTRCVRHKFIF